MAKRSHSSILEAGHRLGDAVIRCTELAESAQAAFRAFLDQDDATEIARLAPTSLVFGVWDSRDTGAKLPRLVQSVIRAWDVAELTRSATYIAPLDYRSLGVFDEKEEEKKKDLSERGYLNAISNDTHGGVVASGLIRRDVTVNLVALRRLKGEGTALLQRYILGLCLTAATADQDGFLRVGCLLCSDPDKPTETTLVWRDGRRETVVLTPDVALAYAKAAADAFGVAAPPSVTFDEKRAKDDAKKK